MDVANPALWSLEERNLYTLVSEVEPGGVITDPSETRFGIRSLRFDPQQGFFLNGKSVKVKGTCNHQDHAGGRCRSARRDAALSRQKAAADGLQRPADFAQPADA